MKNYVEDTHKIGADSVYFLHHAISKEVWLNFTLSSLKSIYFCHLRELVKISNNVARTLRAAIMTLFQKLEEMLSVFHLTWCILHIVSCSLYVLGYLLRLSLAASQRRDWVCSFYLLFIHDFYCKWMLLQHFIQSYDFTFTCCYDLCIYCFACVVPSLHSWDKFYLIIVIIFWCILHSICQICWEFLQLYLSQILICCFFCCVLESFGNQGNLFPFFWILKTVLLLECHGTLLFQTDCALYVEFWYLKIHSFHLLLKKKWFS